MGALGVYAITGGLGGLGIRAATLLIAGGASHVLLASRSGRIVRDGQCLTTPLQMLRAVAIVAACDSATAADMNALVCPGLPSGVLHAAGVGDKGLLVELEAQRAEWMCVSKALGAWHLQCAAAVAPLEARVLFSSVGSALGIVGQANYSAANACLDAHLSLIHI